MKAPVRITSAVARQPIREVERQRDDVESWWLGDIEREAMSRRHVQSLAGIVAAKKAIIRLAGEPPCDTGPADIRIGHDERGAPVVEALPANLASRLPGKLHVSITHTREFAWGLAVLERPA